MNTLIDNNQPTQAIKISSDNIPNGQAFRGRIGGNSPRLFIKIPREDTKFTIFPLDYTTSSAISPLSYYGFSWSNYVTVENYQPVDLEIRVK